MRALRSLLVLLAVVSLAACSTGGGATQSPSASAPSESSAPVPSSVASAGASAAADCNPDTLQTKEAGTLTIGTDNPAYPPFFQIPPEGTEATAPWELGDPTNGEGFEAAFAYALADQLGFAKDNVKWIVSPFDVAIAAGPKDFDLHIAQISYAPERAAVVDLSDGYYFNNQSVVGMGGTPIASAKSIADLKPFTFGAQIGTTSLKTITDVIQPSSEPMIYNTNDDAVAALQAKQIDGLVVDLPTAFYVTSAQVEGSVVVGQFPAPEGTDAEHFSVLLAKDSPLTDCVNQAIGQLKESGELEAITTEWLADKVNAPAFTQ
ncbi:MAG TPA: ABC transporter substrate-binding protein [Candidatus Limnocylindrales bacterium]|nr:ABC transporter substrate-binding protein [Candidatus Limnocylindrales bacterium]